MMHETHVAMLVRRIAPLSLTPFAYDIVAFSLPSLVSWL